VDRPDPRRETLIVQLEEHVESSESAQKAEHEQRLLAEALGEVSAALNSTLELDDVLDLILDRVAGVVPFYRHHHDGRR